MWNLQHLTLSLSYTHLNRATGCLFVWWGQWGPGHGAGTSFDCWLNRSNGELPSGQCPETTSRQLCHSYLWQSRIDHVGSFFPNGKTFVTAITAIKCHAICMTGMITWNVSCNVFYKVESNKYSNSMQSFTSYKYQGILIIIYCDKEIHFAYVTVAMSFGSSVCQ